MLDIACILWPMAAMKQLALILAALLFTACATPGSPPPDSIDAVAEAYVRTSLEIGTHEAGYIDAYYGPESWRSEAEANPHDRAALIAATDALMARITALSSSQAPDALALRRAAYLHAQLRAARTRLEMMGGTRFSFVEEAERLFSVSPELRPLKSYAPVLAEIETLVPGDGPLAERVEAYEDRFTIPSDRLDAVMRAAIAECRARTLAYIALPEAESFRLEFVTDQPWSGYNYYQGNANSLIQINTDLPIRIDRAIDLGCHEGYPGHHAFNMLLEQRLTRERGWVEFSVYPLYSPQSLIAEGSANYGVELAFPADTRRIFEAETLYPLAGLDPAEAGHFLAVQNALSSLASARFTIARDYLEGRIDRSEAIALIRRYMLRSEARAAQSVDFIDTYRSYVINYGLGLDRVRAHVEQAGESDTARWAAMERILSEPTLPRDLAE